MDSGRLDNFVLLPNMVELDFGRLDVFALLRNMVEMDYGRLDNLYYFVIFLSW